MIKLFRKIRQKLLSENKFSKYLIYAIGEIFLVVIGILIALEINIKNQESINREYELTMLNEIREGLIRDLDGLKAGLKLIDNNHIEEHVHKIWFKLNGQIFFKIINKCIASHVHV